MSPRLSENKQKQLPVFIRQENKKLFSEDYEEDESGATSEGLCYYSKFEYGMASGKRSIAGLHRTLFEETSWKAMKRDRCLNSASWARE
jgi:hypothetical protein